MQAERTVRSLAELLARLHATPLTDVERSEAIRAPELARSVASTVSNRSVPGTNRSVAYRHMSDARLVEVLIDGASRCDDRCDGPVLTHGAPTLERMWCAQGSAVGLVGWTRAGVGDRYRDLAGAARSVASALTPHLLPVLFDHYGEASPDPIRLDWYSLWAELVTQDDAALDGDPAP